MPASFQVHPGIPCFRSTSAALLEYFFPEDAKEFQQLAQDCADSRFYAGIHFRTDNETALVMGKAFGKYIIAICKSIQSIITNFLLPTMPLARWIDNVYIPWGSGLRSIRVFKVRPSFIKVCFLITFPATSRRFK